MKFRIKREYLDCDIITKDRSGNDVLVNKLNFNDYLAELLFACGQGHLVELSGEVENELIEKKTFQQLSETTIALIYDPLKKEESSSNETPKEQESKRKRGRQPKAKE